MKKFLLILLSILLILTTVCACGNAEKGTEVEEESLPSDVSRNSKGYPILAYSDITKYIHLDKITTENWDKYFRDLRVDENDSTRQIITLKDDINLYDCEEIALTLYNEKLGITFNCDINRRDSIQHILLLFQGSELDGVGTVYTWVGSGHDYVTESDLLSKGSKISDYKATKASGQVIYENIPSGYYFSMDGEEGCLCVEINENGDTMYFGQNCWSSILETCPELF